MIDGAKLAVVMLAGAGIAYAMRDAFGASVSADAETDNEPDWIDYGQQAVEQATGFFEQVDEMNIGQNTQAFLRAIRYGEGTSSEYGYRTLYGGALFNSYDQHPALTGWGGGRLSDAQCAGAGFGPGCVSTAAGAYQINKPTWNRISAKLQLTDFSPESQDLAALELIREKGALADVAAGRVDLAVSKVRKIWASLPGAGYGQGEVALSTFKNHYLQNGGTYA